MATSPSSSASSTHLLVALSFATALLTAPACDETGGPPNGDGSQDPDGGMEGGTDTSRDAQTGGPADGGATGDTGTRTTRGDGGMGVGAADGGSGGTTGDGGSGGGATGADAASGSTGDGGASETTGGAETTGSTGTTTGTGGMTGTTGLSGTTGSGGSGDACAHDVDCGVDEWCRGSECVTARYCQGDEACSGGEVCDTERGLCTTCLDDDDCGAAGRCRDREQCEAAEPCVNSLDCSGGTVCDVTLGECVTCVTDAECAADEVCFRAECHPACDSDLDCTPLGLLCRRGHPDEPDHCAECTAHVDCDASEYCAAGACRQDVCAPGEQRCDSRLVCGGIDCSFGTDPYCRYCEAGIFPWDSAGQVLTCNAVGDGYEDAFACPVDGIYGSSCFQGGGSASCERRACEPGAQLCSGDYTTARNCSFDGLTLEETVCGTGEACREGVCLPILCDPTALRCQGDEVQRCDASGTSWLSVQTCNIAQYCVELPSPALATCASRYATTDIAMRTALYEDNATSTALGNAILVGNDRDLLWFGVNYAVPSAGSSDGGIGGTLRSVPLSFFVYRDNGDGTYVRLFEHATEAPDACDGDSCRVNLPSRLRLTAGERYLLGMHVTVAPDELPYPQMLTGPRTSGAPLGTVEGGFAESYASPPAATMPAPTLETLGTVSMSVGSEYVD